MKEGKIDKIKGKITKNKRQIFSQRNKNKIKNFKELIFIWKKLTLLHIKISFDHIFIDVYFTGRPFKMGFSIIRGAYKATNHQGKLHFLKLILVIIQEKLQESYLKDF